MRTLPVSPVTTPTMPHPFGVAAASLRTPATPAPHPPRSEGPVQRQVNSAASGFADVALPYCDGLVADTAPPAWQLVQVNGTLRASLVRQGATLAGLDNPFACTVTASPARISATQVDLASQTDVLASDGWLASACAAPSPTFAAALAGYRVSNNGTGSVWAARDDNATAAACDSPTPVTWAPLVLAPVTLQEPTSTGALLPGLSNLSYPSAGVAALCAPVVASAVAQALGNANLSDAVASLSASVENRGKVWVFQTFGNAGGTIMLILAGGVLSAAGALLARCCTQRNKTTATAASGAPPASGGLGDVLQDIPLTPTHPHPYGGADKSNNNSYAQLPLLPR